MTWAIDFGSTSVKCCCFDLEPETPQLLHQSSHRCPLLRPRPGWVEHDLDGLTAIFSTLLEAIPEQADVGLASAMHGLVLLDEGGEPLGNAISWADTRSQAQAETLQREDPAAYHRTGVPLHSMAWPAKLLWVADQRRDWWRRLRRVTDLKSYLWERVLGITAPLDRSSASATGLWNSIEQSWDQLLCRRLGLSHHLLPSVENDHRREWQGKTVYLGGADGPLGNLGLGAVDEGQIAVSVGTSGAVRRFHHQSRRPTDGLFLYALDRWGWVEGGAISNGGSVLHWLSEPSSLAPGSLGHSPTPEQLFSAVEQVEVGADGLLIHPYFQGERAPFWRPNVQAAVHGQNARHHLGHVARATLEGVAFCLHRLLTLLEADGQPLRCTGGLFASPVWCQLLADVTGRPLAVSPVSEATALGAALLTLPDPLERARRLPLGPRWLPERDLHQRYRELYVNWLSLDPAVSPSWQDRP